MATVVLASGLARIEESKDVSWDPGPPLAAEWTGGPSAWPAIAATACAVRDGHVDVDPARPARVELASPLGDITTYAHGATGAPSMVLLELQAPHTVRDRLMVQLVAMSVGVPPNSVMSAGSQPQVVDVGVPTLVVPVSDPEHVEGLKAGDLSRAAPEAEAVVAYTITQRRPYAKATVRAVPGEHAAEPFVWAAAAVHAISSGALRADYPVTRFVLSSPGLEGRMECRCHLEKGGAGPRFVHVRVGGAVAFE